VIERSGLSTWSVAGDDLAPLARELATASGVASVTPFGTQLHVSGTDDAALAATVGRYRRRSDLVWTRSAPNLEDVFIHLMVAAGDRIN
jgi:ABC-2 type transport system ATP-binding protein